jgi:hypothetical protein
MADDIFENNIVYAGTRCLIAVNKTKIDKNQPPATIDHNLYYCDAEAKASKWIESGENVTGFEKYVQSTGNDGHTTFSNPRFTDPANKDFHLRVDSPAIGSGIAAGLTVGEVDLDGMPRMKSGKVDLGCYQTK